MHRLAVDELVVIQHQGIYGELYSAVNAWLAAYGGDQRLPDDVQVNKGHGRLERRELWVVPAQKLGDYLQQEFDWPGVHLCGLIRRYRRRTHQVDWDSVKKWTWIAGGSLPDSAPVQLQSLLRRHWGIENGVFYVRDLSQSEDRLHGRTIGFSLSAFRNGVNNLIRRAGYRYIPDAKRFL